MERIKILIVEDEPFIARNLQQILSAKKYLVSGIAYDKLSALDKLAQNETDLVLLDINLNGEFSGLEIAEKIYTFYKIPFIFITSYAGEDILSKAKHTMPSGYIVKPFEERDIYAAIEIAWFNFTQQTNSKFTFDSVNARINSPLTPKEFQVLLKLLEGKAYQEVADLHHVSINTINTHVKSIYSKMNVHSRGEALQFLNEQP